MKDQRIIHLGLLKSAIVLSCFSTAVVLANPDYTYIAFHPVPLSGADQSTLPAPGVMQAGPGQTTDSPMLAASIARYHADIAAMEAEGSPFNPGIGQQSSALGALLMQQGDLEGAAAAFEKSLHILRINEGLYSTEQIRVMGELIEVQLGLGNLQRAHELHAAMLHQQKGLYGKGDSAYIAALLEWADWNVDLLLVPGSDFPETGGKQGDRFSQTLIDAQANYIEAIKLIRTSGSQPAVDERLIHAEKKLAAINYIANTRTGISQARFSPMLEETNPFTAEKRREDRAEMAYFFNGSNALKRAIAYSLESPQPDYLSIAEQMMALGDWNLLFDRRAAALSIYEDAFEVLDAVQASEEDIRRVMTPGMQVMTPSALSGGNLAGNAFNGYIDVEFTVSKFGIATSPEIIAVSGEDASPVTSALIRKIRNERFRPAFIDGSATSGENVKLRYYYSYN